MEVMLAVLTGILVAAGAYLMMSGRTLPYLFGLTMISNAANLLIFTSGRLTFGQPAAGPRRRQDRRRRRQRPAAGADPDRHRHRLRPPGLRARAGLPLLLRARHHRDGRDARGRAGAGGRPLVLLFWPLVIPFATAVLCILAWRSPAAAARHLARRRAGRSSPSRCASSPGSPRRPLRRAGRRLAGALRHHAGRRLALGDHGASSIGLVAVAVAGLRPRRRHARGGAQRPPPAHPRRCSPASAAPS